MGEYCTLTSYDYSITILLLMHLNFSCCFVILYGWAYSSGNIYVAFWLYDLREVKMFIFQPTLFGSGYFRWTGRNADEDGIVSHHQDSPGQTRFSFGGSLFAD